MQGSEVDNKLASSNPNHPLRCIVCPKTPSAFLWGKEGGSRFRRVSRQGVNPSFGSSWALNRSQLKAYWLIGKD